MKCLTLLFVMVYLYSGFAPLFAQKNSDHPAVEEVHISSSQERLLCTFTTNKRFRALPRLSLNGKTLAIRFVGATSGINPDEHKHAAIVSFKRKQERRDAVFVVTLRKTPDTCTVLREGVKSFVVQIQVELPRSAEKNGDAKKQTADKPQKLGKTEKMTAGKGKETPVQKKTSLPEKTETPATDVHDESETAETDVSGKNKWALDVIVIDPGHGGKDAGTVGITGVKEKDVVLGIGLKLGALIKKNLRGTKVVFTRDDDRFIELDRRGQIANEAGGKLFVSIHCNATPKKPSKANGFEVYILRPGRTDDAVRVAELENSVIRYEGNNNRYKKLTDEQFIIVNMAQSAFVKFSDTFAGLLTRELDGQTPLHNRGVNQAGFFVLVGASMPNVLIETAFLSNKKDAQYLASAKGQQQIASGIFRAIQLYRALYQKQLQQETQKK